MPQLASQLNPRSEEFKANAAAMRALVDDLHAQLERIAQGGGRRARQAPWRAASCCRASASNVLLDPGTPFLEIGAAGRAGRVQGQGRQRRRARRRHDHRHRPRRPASSA